MYALLFVGVRTCLNVGPCHVVPRSCHGSSCSSSSALLPSTSPCSTSCLAARCGCILTTTSKSRCLTHLLTALCDWHLLAPPPERCWWEGMRQSTHVGRSFHIGHHVTFPVVACAGWRPPGDSCAVFTSNHHRGRLLWWHLCLRPHGNAAKAAGEQLASLASAVLQIIGLWCLLGSGLSPAYSHQEEPQIGGKGMAFPLGQHALPPIHLQTVGVRPSSCNPDHCICMRCCTQYYLFEYVMNQRRRNAAYRVNAQTQGGIGSKRTS